MRQLHLVENDTEAGRVVLATSDGQERFELTVDRALRSAVSEVPVRPTTAVSSVTGPSEPRVTPREIQMRVRGGETPESLADSYNASLDWIMRFATPVLAERSRIADEGRRARARRSTTEGQLVVFGEAVDERFSAHGIDPSSVRWDAHRRDDGQWVLVASWIGGQAEREAEWSFHLTGRTVAPLDDTAADLLSDRPIRPIAPPVAPVAPEEPERTAPGLALAPPLEPGLVAFPAMPDAHTGPLPRAEDVFDQARFEEPQLPMHVPDAPDAPEVPPAQPARPARPARKAKVTNLGVAGREDESDDDKAARAAIPSWDDILLGVRRKRD
jgi:hypothetical protein